MNNIRSSNFQSESNNNHINHNNRMNDRQFNLPNIPYNPHNAQNIYENSNSYKPYTQNKMPTSYVPRMEQPQMQAKLDKNTMENQYQNAYQQRNFDSGFTPLNQFTSDNNVQVYNNESELDISLKIFQLSEQFTESQLKESYKKLVYKYHPDRGGDNTKFQYITKCYTFLLQQLELKIKDAQFQQLKEQSINSIESQKTYQNTKFDKDKFDINQFNDIFNNNKLDNDDDSGYNEWIQNNKYDSEDISKNSQLNGKFNIDNFNNVFSDNKTNDKMELVEYKDPVPTELNNNLQFSEIDDTVKGDYSSDVNNQLLYTDYKKAHTKTHLIDPNSINRREYKNIDDLENERSNINYQMSEKDLIEDRIRKDQIELDEQERIKRIQYRDNKITDNYGKINKMMIGN